jgi:hypothetical protein
LRRRIAAAGPWTILGNTDATGPRTKPRSSPCQCVLASSP